MKKYVLNLAGCVYLILNFKSKVEYFFYEVYMYIFAQRRLSFVLNQ